jgi:hypothetical protein
MHQPARALMGITRGMDARIQRRRLGALASSHGAGAVHYLPALALGLALLPLAVGVVVALVQTGEDLYPWGDHAVVEIETLKTWHGDQLLGTYSRYTWHHPGPALFWFMAPPYMLAGQSTAALNAAVAILNLIAAALIVGVTARLAGRAAAFLAAALTGLWIAQVGPEIIRDFWIPNATVLPFGALVVTTAAVAAGELRLLPAVAILASLLAETNLSVAPAAVAVVVAGALFFAFSRGWSGLGSRGAGLAVGMSLLLAAAIWWPPLQEELQQPEGNIQTLREFFSTPDPGHSLREGVSAVANSLTTLPTGRREAELAVPAGTGAHLLLALAGLLLTTGLGVAWSRGRRFAAALCAICLGAIAAEIYAVTRIRGEIFTYLVGGFGVTAIAIVLAVALALGPELTRAGRRLVPLTRATAIVAAAALGAYNLLQVAGNASFDSADPAYSKSPVVKRTWRSVDGWLRRNQIREPVVYIPSAAQWPFAAGTILQLFRDGRAVAVDPAYGFIFGEPFAPTGREDAAIVFADGGSRPPPASDAMIVAEVGGTTVYARRLRPSASS